MTPFPSIIDNGAGTVGVEPPRLGATPSGIGGAGGNRDRSLTFASSLAVINGVLLWEDDTAAVSDCARVLIFVRARWPLNGGMRLNLSAVVTSGITSDLLSSP